MTTADLLRTVFAFTLLATADLARADEETRAYHIVAGIPEVSKTAQAKAGDFLSAPDWGILVEGPRGQLAVIPVEEGGQGYFEISARATPRIRLVDIDLTSHDLLTDPVDLPTACKDRRIEWPDGSAITVSVDAFDPEADSGADARPEGAETLTEGAAAQGEVDFAQGDRTDHWALAVDAPSPAFALVFHPEGPPAIGWRREERGGNFETVGWATHGTVSVYHGHLEPGRNTLRFRAPPGASKLGYRVIVALDHHGELDTGALARTLIHWLASRESLPFAAGREEAHALREIDGPGARQAVSAALEDPSAGVREFAATAAGLLRIADAEPILQRMAQEDAERGVKRAAADALRALRRKK